MDEPWIKLLLQARASRTWYTNRFSEAQAWVDLILIKVGKIIMSERQLAKKWEWSTTKTHRFLLREKNHPKKHLKKQTMPLIPVSSTGKKSPKKAPKKSQKQKEYTQEFLTFLQAYPGKKNKDYAFECWQRKANVRPPLNDIVTAIAAQVIERKQQRDAGKKFIAEWKNASTWINQGCWHDVVEKANDSSTAAPKLPYVKDVNFEENGTSKYRDISKLTNNIGREIP